MSTRQDGPTIVGGLDDTDRSGRPLLIDHATGAAVVTGVIGGTPFAVRDGHQALPAFAWTQIHVPNTNTQATKTQTSAGAGKRNVCTGFTVTMTAGASAPTAAAPILVSVIDGASGGSTYLWRSYITLPAVAGAVVSMIRSDLWLVGSQATAMTIEFSAAGGANTYESVAFDGVVIEE